MKIGKFTAVNRTDVPQAPEWTDKLLKPFNTALKELNTLGQKQISFTDNCNTEPRELRVKHETPYELTLNVLKGKPLGAMVLWTSVNDYLPRLKFEIQDEKKVKVTFKFDSAPSGEVDVKILIIGK
jgi:hypothetical protein